MGNTGGRPPGAKNKLTKEKIEAAQELAATYGDPLKDLYVKRERWQQVYDEQLSKPPRRRNYKKLQEAEDRILRINEAILPFDRPRYSTINQTSQVQIAPTVIRAPQTISDSKAWLEAHRPKRLDAPASPELRIVTNVRSALATAEQLGGDIGAAQIFSEAAKATKNEDKS